MKKQKQLTMPRLMVEGAGSCSDLLFRSGFMPVDPVVFLDEGARRTLVVPLLEYSRAISEAPGVEVLLPEKTGVSKKNARSLSAWTVQLMRYRRVKKVCVGAFFPAAMLRALEHSGIRIEIAQGSLYPERAIKSAKAIEKITASQRAAVQAMNEAEKILRKATVGKTGTLKWQGHTLTSEILRTAIDTELLRHGCHARDTIVAGGAQAADPHERGHGPLKAGESIVIDIFPQHKRTGYWGDITRTFCKGRPAPALAKMFNTVLRAQKMALSLIKPGCNGSTIHEAVAAFFVKEGYPTRVEGGVVRGFFHGTGHGVGLDIHESPGINRTENKLKQGNVVTVEPGLYDPDIGGVRIEDTVVIERGGPRILASCPVRFLV